MILFKTNETFAATALLLLTTSMSMLLSVSMVEGQFPQEKNGNLRDLSSSDDKPIAPVNLLSAGNFAVLSKAGVTTTGTTSVTGDIGTSPVAASYFTGFGLSLDPNSSGTFATSSKVVGKLYAADLTSPTPSMLTIAISNMQDAYVDAAGRSNPDVTELGDGQIDRLTLEPALYKWGTGVNVPNRLTFDADGDADAVWILQIAGDVNIGNGAKISLSGGAKAENIFWQVAGGTLFGTTSHVEGVFLCATAIKFQTGSSLNGAALAQTAVTMDSATIVKKSV